MTNDGETPFTSPDPEGGATGSVVEPPVTDRAPRKLAVLIVVLAVASFLYRVLVNGRLEQSAALFVGLPAFIAIGLSLTPRAKSPMGIMFKGMTIALLISAIFLGEGFICVLMAAPLFYLVGVIVTLVIIYTRKKDGGQATMGAAALLLVPMILEGVTEQLSFDRREVITVQRVIDAPASAVEARLASELAFDRPLPMALQVGFPRPVRARGQGLAVGDQRVVRFAGGEGQPGDLVLEVTDRAPDRVEFTTLRDDSHIAHWLEWDKSDVQWISVGDRTRVTWTLRYRRALDPAWYFGPIERAAVKVTAGYLIDALAAP